MIRTHVSRSSFVKKYAICAAGALFLLILVASVMSPARTVQAQIPYGGIVGSIQPCNVGLLLYVTTFYGVMPVMWLWGNLPYLMYVPPHPGQWMWGMLDSVPKTCELGPVTYGAGLPILFHGEGI